jgi:ERCC4-type nuclease
MIVKVIVDTREKEKLFNYLQKHFPDVTFERQTLQQGDYCMEAEDLECSLNPLYYAENGDFKVLVERKQVADLVGSVFQNKRLSSQLEKLSTMDENVVKVILVTGDVDAFLGKTNSIKKLPTVSGEFIENVVASVGYRYGIHIMWIEDERRAFEVMIQFMKKVCDGKYLVPSAWDKDVLMTRLLKVKRHEWFDIKKKFGSISNISMATVSELRTIYGIGPQKAKRILEILNGE